MASGLNLNPDIVVVSTQAVLFLTNLFIVKKLILDPYLELKSKRDLMTIQSDSSADELFAKVKQAESEILQKTKEAHRFAATTREQQKKKAEAVRIAAVKEAERVVKSEQALIQQNIENQMKSLDQEKARAIEDLAQEFVKSATAT